MISTRREQLLNDDDNNLTVNYLAVGFDKALPPVALLRNIIFHLDTVQFAATTIDIILLGGDGTATRKKYTLEITALPLLKDAVDSTKAMYVYDFGEAGMQYNELAYCGALQAVLIKLDASTAVLKSVALNYEV